MTDVLETPIDDLGMLLGSQQDLPPPIPDMMGRETHMPNPIGGRASNLNYATNVAALSQNPEEAVETYRRIDSELSATGTSETARGIISKTADEELDNQKAQLTQLLLDDTISDVDKAAYADEVMNKYSKQFSIHDAIITRAAIQSSGAEDLDEESTRVAVAQTLDEYNAYRKLSQTILNKEAAKADANTMSAWADIFQYLMPGAQGEFTAKTFDQMRGGDGDVWDSLATFFKMGHDTKAMRDMIASVPFKDRAVILEKFQEIAHSPKSIISWDENDYARQTMLRNVLEEGGYSDTDKWIDTVTGWLDITGLGGTIRYGRQLAKDIKNAESMLEDVTALRHIKEGQQPASYAAAMQDSNPEKAKAVFKTIDEAKDDEAALALAGTTRENYLVDSLTPDAATQSGAIASKPALSFIDDEVRKQHLYGVSPNDFYRFSEEEVARLQNVAGLSARPELGQVQNTDYGLGISMVYGPPTGAWSDPTVAREAVELATRRFNVKPEDISVIERQGTLYVPTGRQVKGKSVVKEQPKQYLVKVNYNRVYQTPTNPDDIDVANNLLDVLNIGVGKGDKGTLSASTVTYAGMLPKRIFGGALAAEDKSAFLQKELLKSAEPFSKAIVKLPADRQEKVLNFIRDMNDKRMWPSDSDMMLKHDLSRQEVEALDSWRRTWDTMHRIEQRDLNKSLRKDGWMSYTNKATNTELVAKPYARQGVPSNVTVIDEASNTPRALSRQEVDELYESGGSIMKLKTPIKVADEDVIFVANRNNGSSYAREINDEYASLQYIPGYYTRRYTENFFLVRKYTDKDGNHLPEYDSVVANVGTSREAESVRSDLSRRKGVPIEDYYIREDMKKGDLPGDVTFSMNHSFGRLAQKHRGQRLAGYADGIVGPSDANVMGPVDSLMLQTNSLAKRVAYRDYLDNYKATAMEKYKEFLPSDGMGGVRLPKDLSEIAYRPASGKDLNKKKLGDARTVFSHIQYLENGYINSIDELYRKSMQGIADALDVRGFGKVSKGARKASQVNLTSAERALVFNALIATNPFRQIVIQGHQVMQLIPHYNFPRVVLPSFADAQAIVTRQLGSDVLTKRIKGGDEMYEQYIASGLSASVDRQNLVRGSMLQLADESSLMARTKFGRAVSKPIDFARTVGFDAGENVLMTFSWAAARRKLLDARRVKGNMSTKLSAVEQGQIAEEARRITYSMNRAGDVPYNQNALSMFMQFQQVPHKTLIQMTVDRGIDRNTKFKLWAYNSLMYGIPLGFGTYVIEKLNLSPEDAALATRLNKGFESWAFNNLLAQSFTDLGDNGHAGIDFGGLAPWDLTGTYEMFAELWSGNGIPGFISKTPMATTAKRFQDVYYTASRAFNFDNANHNEWFVENKTDMVSILDSIARISSGYSNAKKAYIAFETKKKLTASGFVSDQDVTAVQSFFTALGFPTEDEARKYYVMTKLSESSKDFEADVLHQYDVFKRGIASEGVDMSNLDSYLAAHEAMWSLYRGSDRFKAQEIIRRRLKMDVQNGDISLFNSVLEKSNYIPEAELSAIIANLPADPNQEVNDQRKDILKQMYDQRKEYDKGNQ